MLRDSRELGLIPLDYNLVIDTPGTCSVPFSPGSRDEAAGSLRQRGCWLVRFGLTQPRDGREGGRWHEKLTPPGPHLP